LRLTYNNKTNYKTKEVFTMAQKKQNNLDSLRSALRAKAEQSTGGAQAGNPLEFTPDIGTTKIRILPPIGDNFSKDPMSVSENEMFYYTHKFHFIPESLESIGTPKGKFLWTPKFLTDKTGNATRKCPICEAVQQFYAVGRKEGNDYLQKLGGALKLKRHYYMNVLLYKEDGSVEYRILVDKTNEGKLVKVMCAAMGIPFFRDIEDNWVDKNSLDFDPDQEYYDLLDINEGYDFKIVKEKTGINNWDISFEKSFVMKKNTRALTDEELELMASRVNLKTAVNYEHSYEAVKAIYDNLIGDSVDVDSEEEEQAVLPKTKAPMTSPKPKAKAPVGTDDEKEMEDLLNELD